MNRGFTLIEIIAAITVLGLVAAAVIPMSLHLGQARLGIDEHLRARNWLLGQTDTGTDDSDRISAIADHPGWYLHRVVFLRTSAKAPATMWDAPEHRWVHLMVRQGPGPEAPLLADRILIPATDRPARAPAP